MNTNLKRTPLFTRHQQLGATLIPFGGWELPLEFESTRSEHAAVREQAGVFDIGHMGVVTVRGTKAEEYLQHLLTNNVHRLSHTGKVLYTCMCNEQGGILDDLLVYENFEEGLLLVINGATTEKDLAWMYQQAQAMGYDPVEVSIAHRTDLCMIALQGPQSVQLLQPMVSVYLDHINYYNGIPVRLKDRRLDYERGPAILSRTGYTGENGFEIIAPADMIVMLWDALIAGGAKPCGLAARDILRLEMGYSLYGQDITEETTPLEANLSWIVSFKKEERFIGREALERQRETKPRRKLVGMVLEGRGQPRTGYPVYAGGEEVGMITSGAISPRLETGIALGYVNTDVAETTPPLEIGIRSRRVTAHIVDLPFYHPPKPARLAADKQPAQLQTKGE